MGSDVAFPTHHLASMLCEFPKRLHENVSLEPRSRSAMRTRLVPAERRRLDGGAHVLPRGGRRRAGTARLPGVFCPHGLGRSSRLAAAIQGLLQALPWLRLPSTLLGLDLHVRKVRCHLLAREICSGPTDNNGGSWDWNPALLGSCPFPVAAHLPGLIT